MIGDFIASELTRMDGLAPAPGTAAPNAERLSELFRTLLAEVWRAA